MPQQQGYMDVRLMLRDMVAVVFIRDWFSWELDTGLDYLLRVWRQADQSCGAYATCSGWREKQHLIHSL